MSHNPPKSDICFHCGEALPDNGIGTILFNEKVQSVCCIGCKAVAEYIIESGLGNYYRHRKDLPEKVDESSILDSSDWQVFDKYLENAGIKNSSDNSGPDSSQQEIMLDIEGLHCVSCSWLIQNKLEENSAVKVKSLDQQTGIATIRWDNYKTRLSSILQTINALGYQPHVLDSSGAELEELSGRQNENSLKRLVVAGLGMMQVMMFAVALYTGNEQNMQTVYRRFLIWVSMLVTFPVLFYSGMPFLRHAWQSIKVKRLHMDIPIAIALLSAFTLSVVNSLFGTGEVYFDSVVMFVFFLSVSRYIQERITRNMISSRQAFARMLPILVDVEANGVITKKPVAEISKGDVFAVPSGAVIAADGAVISGKTEVDAASLTGESRSLQAKKGDVVFAGMRNLGQPVQIRASKDMRRSAISILSQRLAKASFVTQKEQLFVTRYVTLFILCTLLIATSVFVYWYSQGQWQHGFEIALAVLVVSCPCALSIAMPSSIASLTKQLHSLGIYVINPSKLFNLTRITAVILDKTGTLTDPHQELVSTLDSNASEHYLGLAKALSNFTQHPKARFLNDTEQTHLVENVIEEVGQGVSGSIDGTRYYLGSADLVTKDSVTSSSYGNALCFGDGENCLLHWKQDESIRTGAKDLIARFKDTGVKTYLSSGDHPLAVSSLSNTLGIDNFYSEQSSSQKLALLEDLQATGETVLCIGDGVNDAEFLQQADLSISFTNATELAQAQADILLANTQLDKVRELLESATKLKLIYKQNLAWAISYNLVMLPLAILGFIQPWIAALGMSFSSLFVVLNSLRLSQVKQTKSITSLDEVHAI